MKAPPSSESCSVPVPPENVAVSVPFDRPAQPSLLVSVRLIALGWVKVLVWVLVHRLASRTITVWEPEASPVNV